MKPIHRIQIDERHSRKLSTRSSEVSLYPASPQEFYVSNTTLEQLKSWRIPHKILKSLEVEETGVELIYPSHSHLFEPPTTDAVHEAIAYALSHKKGKKRTQLFYEGRHYVRKALEDEGYFYLDRPQGRRSYLWRIPRKREKVQDIRNMFPHLEKLIRDPNTRVALSFGSGGVRLYAHPSLMRFINFMGWRSEIDEVWGCSGGAVAGLPYALGIEPHLIEEEGYHFYNDRFSVRLSPHKLKVLKNIFIDYLLPNSDHMLKGFLDCQREFREIFGKHIQQMRSHEKSIPFFCTAYNLKSQNLEILSPEPIQEPNYPTPIFHTKALEAVMASSSVPILYIPTKIKRGKTECNYVDGAIIEELPLVSIYQKWHEDRRLHKEKRKKLLIICVNLLPKFEGLFLLNHRILGLLPISRFFKLFTKYIDLVRKARIEEHLKILKHNHVEVLELNLPIQNGSMLNTKCIPGIIKTAQQSFFKQLLAIEKNLTQH